MKKSFMFYIIALVTSLVSYVINIFAFLNTFNNTKISNEYEFQMYFYLIIMIITIPLFVISIVLMIASVKKTNEISIVPIILLVINLVVMFILYSTVSIHTFKVSYDQYSRLIEGITESDELYAVYSTLKTGLIYSLISGYILPIVYLISSVLALIFKVDEKKVK